jgi:hypothetical protein
MKVATAASAADEPIANMTSTRVSWSIAHLQTPQKTKPRRRKGERWGLSRLFRQGGTNSRYLLPAWDILSKPFMFCCNLPNSAHCVFSLPNCTISAQVFDTRLAEDSQARGRWMTSDALYPITDACPALKTCRFRSLNRHVPPGGIAKGLEFAFVHRQRRRVARKLLRQSRNIPISCYRPRKTSAGLRAASAAPMPRTVVGAAHPLSESGMMAPAALGLSPGATKRGVGFSLTFTGAAHHHH